MTSNSAILPFDLCALASFHINSFILFIANIAIGSFQLTDIVFAGSEFIADIGVAVLVRFYFHDWVLTRIVNDKLNAIDALSSVCINLMDHDGTHALIGDLYRCGLAILNAGIDGGGVERITVCRFAFNNGVPSTFRVRNTDDAISVGGVGANDLTIHLADLEFDPGDTLSQFAHQCLRRT